MEDKNAIYKALHQAQTQMRGAKRDSTNPHFRSSYADLESVQKACFPQLHAAGIVVVQEPGTDEYGPFLKTVFIHAETGESVSNRVPVLTTKQDAQGYGSGLTYARRYGLMCLAGLAPTDDDGNAACEPEEQAPPADAFLAEPKTNRQWSDRIVAKANLMSCFLEEDHFLQFVEIGWGKRLKELNRGQLKALNQWLDDHQSFESWSDKARQNLRDAERLIGV